MIRDSIPHHQMVERIPAVLPIPDDPGASAVRALARRYEAIVSAVPRQPPSSQILN